MVNPTVLEQGQTSEAKTECSDCSFTDYWAYGHFESGEYMIGKCAKYYR